MIKELAQTLVDLIFEWGYLGIFLLMLVESSFIPFPSEIILIPAGYLISQEKMSFILVMISAIGGSLAGAFINYYFALIVGRRFLVRFGKWFFIKESTLFKMDIYFTKHGPISTFIGRLLPGVRQLISIPAGLARMDIKLFTIFTTLGAGIWALILVLLGYFIGENQELIDTYLKQIIITLIIVLTILGILYVYYQKRRKLL